MNRVYLVFLLLAFSSSAWSFQCGQDNSLEKVFGDAERGFLVYITETRLEEDLLLELEEKYEEADAESEYVKLVSAGYRVIENFKGPVTYQPRLLDMLGIGTGYVGLSAGQYYLVLLPKEDSTDFRGMRRVNICTVPISHYRLNEEQFQVQLRKVRKLRESIR